MYWLAFATGLNIQQHCSLPGSDFYNQSVVVDPKNPMANIMWCPVQNTKANTMNHLVPLLQCDDGVL